MGNLKRWFRPYRFGRGTACRHGYNPCRAGDVTRARAGRCRDYCVGCGRKGGASVGLHRSSSSPCPRPPVGEGQRVGPDGRIYHVITRGQKSDAELLLADPAEDRWAVIPLRARYSKRAAHRAARPESRGDQGGLDRG